MGTTFLYSPLIKFVGKNKEENFKKRKEKTLFLHNVQVDKVYQTKKVSIRIWIGIIGVGQDETVPQGVKFSYLMICQELRRSLEREDGSTTEKRHTNARNGALVPGRLSSKHAEERGRDNEISSTVSPCPISLIGSYYKIIAKMLSNRLRKVVPNIIGSEQSAFMSGRYILDGVLVANETVDFIKRNKRHGLIFKVDFEKAFDSLNWSFLFEVMECMGFGARWRSWIKSCLCSASISILINGSPTSEFHLGRGVRQGDPLSPFLFIIAAEGLNILSKVAVSKGLYKGVEVGAEKVVISHLQYADDTIFFGEWSRRNARNLMYLLECFEKASGLKVNYNKSQLYGIGVNCSEVENLASWCNCQAGSLPFIYLGLPVGSNMKKLESWNPVIDKFTKRLADWRARSVSFGGRLTLVKSVLSSLPLYYFSLFRAPPCVLKKLECVRRSFFWGGSGSNKKVSWVKWEKLLLPHEEGGLNIKSLFCKNLALLCKWWWRFISETNTLWINVIRSIYGHYGGLSVGEGSSRILTGGIWSNIRDAGFKTDELGIPFSKSFKKILGDGCDTRFWTENWLGNMALKNKFKRLFRLEASQSAAVSDRLQIQNWSVMGKWAWVRDPVGRTHGELIELNSLLGNVTFSIGSKDWWVWILDTCNRFTVKKLCNLIDLKYITVDRSDVTTLRNQFVPKKIELFIWRARLGRIPVRVELDKRGIDLDNVRCPICNGDIESVMHILKTCNFANDLWNRVFSWWKLDSSSLNLDDLFSGSNSTLNSDWKIHVWQAVCWIVLYWIWKYRNQKVFNNKCITIPSVFNEIQVISYDWISRRCKKANLEWLIWISNPKECG
ncbi:uncharacterized protein [Rutidosis leptorrhynchoides]|uniref:uncharacterized protein n=1 Tax=Rutidosis leptorrhynchoides TaxID=125765 RepID=UPI003A99D8D0